MIEWNRDTRYRSAALGSPNTIVIDLGSEQEVKALVLFDHNFTSGADIDIEGNDADAWGAPAFTEAVTWSADKLLHYLSSAQTYRYWRITIDDAANTDGYIEIGELFLGSYFEPTKNFVYGDDYEFEFIFEQEKSKYGVHKNMYFNLSQKADLDFEGIPESDMDDFLTMFRYLGQQSSGIMQPLYFNRDVSDTADCCLMEMTKLNRKSRPHDYFDTRIEMEEVLKSV